MALLKSKTDSSSKAALPGLLRNLFDPVEGERFLVLCDTPTPGRAGHEAWTARRGMAEDWRKQLAALHADVPGVVEFAALEPGAAAVNTAAFASVLRGSSCALVFCETHAPEAWAGVLRDHPGLRVALLPAAARRMEENTWNPELPSVGRRVDHLHALLKRSVGMRVQFSTGQEAYFDLRFQTPGFRPASCRPGGPRLVTLPGGEVWTGTYAGDGSDPMCDTIGIIPFYQNGLLYQFFVERGRVMDVIGDGPQAEKYRAWFQAHPGGCPIRRLGLGCNPRASVGRNRLKTRTAGFYWSIDPQPEPTRLSEPDPAAGEPPLDYCYAANQPVVAVEVNLLLDDTSEVVVIDGGRAIIE